MRSVDKAISASKSKIHNARFVLTQIHGGFFVDLCECLEVRVDRGSSIRQIERIMMRKGLKLFR